MKLSKAIDMYLKFVKKEHAASTLKGYKGRLKTLREQLGKKKVEKLTSEKIGEWIEAVTHWPDGSPKAPDTIRLTVIAWEQLQKHMLSNGTIEEPIFDYGKKPGGRRRSRIPTRLEQARIFREALRSGRREWALIFRCLRLCGARPGELVGADIAQYDQEQSIITLAEHKTAKKTGEARNIGVGRTMRRLMERAIGSRDIGPIFLDERGDRWKREKVSRIFREIRNKLGISREIVLYCTRHEHGTILCEKHGIHVAQHSLGHRDIQTTQRYVHPDPAKLAGYQDVI